MSLQHPASRRIQSCECARRHGPEGGSTFQENFAGRCSSHFAIRGTFGASCLVLI
jgi:hypothetical protein